MRSEKMFARIIGVVGILLAGVAVMPVQAAGSLQMPGSGPVIIKLNDNVPLPAHPPGKTFAALRKMMRVAAGLSDQGYYQKSSPDYDAIIALLRKEKGNNHQDVAYLTNPKAGNLEAQGLNYGGERHRRRQLLVLQYNGNKTRPETGFAYEWVAYNLVMQGNFKQALGPLDLALVSHMGHSGRNHFDAARVQFLKAYVLAELGQMDKALPFFEEAAAFVQNTPGTMPYEHLEMLKTLVALVGYAPPWGPLDRQKILEKLYGEKAASEMDYGTIQPPLKARSRKQNLMYRAFRQLLSARALMAEGKPVNALVRMRQAMALVRRVERESGKAVIHRRFKNTLQELLVLNGLHEEGEAHYQALAAREKGNYWRQEGYRTTHLARMASHLKFAGKHKLATKIMNKANAITNHIKSGNPGPDRANLYSNRIDILIAQQRFKEAEKSLRVYLHYGETRLSLPDSVSLLHASSYSRLAQILLKQDRKTEARELLEKAIQISRFGSNGPVYGYLFPEALMDHHFGESASGRPTKKQNIARMGFAKTWAERGLKIDALLPAGYHMRDVVTIQEQILAPNDAQLASAYRDIARNIRKAGYDKKKQFTSAKKYLEMAIAAQEKNPAASPRDLSDTYGELSALVGSTGDFAAMLPPLRKAVLVHMRVEKIDQVNTGIAFANLANAHSVAGYGDVAHYLYKKAAQVLADSEGADGVLAAEFAASAKKFINPQGTRSPRDLTTVLMNNGLERMNADDPGGVIEFYRDAAIIYTAEGSVVPEFAGIEVEVGQTLGLVLGDWTGAVRILQWSLDMHASKNGLGEPGSIYRSIYLAEAIAKTGNVDAARLMFEETLKLAKVATSPDPQTIESIEKLIVKWSGNALDVGQLRQIAKWVEWNTPPDQLDRAIAYEALADKLRKRGFNEEASDYYFRAINIYERNEEDRLFSYRMVSARSGLVALLLKESRFQEAGSLARFVLAEANKIPDNPIARALAAHTMAYYLGATGKLEEGLQLLRGSRKDVVKIDKAWPGIFPGWFKKLEYMENIFVEQIRKKGGG